MFCWLNAIERAVVSGEDVKQPLVVEVSVCEAKTRVDRSVVYQNKNHCSCGQCTFLFSPLSVRTLKDVFFILIL